MRHFGGMVAVVRRLLRILSAAASVVGAVPGGRLTLLGAFLLSCGRLGSRSLGTLRRCLRASLLSAWGSLWLRCRPLGWLLRSGGCGCGALCRGL